MSQPVFISYARDASRDKAEALHNALGGRTAFLDTKNIAPGERFPEALVDALFDAKVVVIFAEPQYFTRWYCLLEFRIARTPFLRAVDRPGATVQDKEDALRGLVVAMPPRGVDPMMERFPPLVQGRNWPAVDDIDAIAALVEAEFAVSPPTLRERYASVVDADAARSFLLEATRLPPPMRIGNLPFVPQIGLAPTIGDAFVGRADDLWRIHDLLWTERGDPATAAGLTGSIEAIGGFGKTRLALEYLYRFGPRHFKGGLFWINAESDPELQLYDVLQALNPNAPAIEHVRQGSGGVAGAVARAIRARPDDSATPLFIIDNVPEPQADQSPKPLNTWCPVLGEVPVLTTSRTQVAIGEGGNAVALPIDTLDPASAVELLTTKIRRDQLDDAGWKHIAEWVGHLPLALEVLNRLLRSGEMTPPALLSLSREQRPSAAIDEAKKSIEHVVPSGALRGITEAFSASYDRLAPEEQYAARLTAWMAPAPIPTFVIDAFGPEVFAPGIRAKLRNRSFVTEVRDSSADFFGSMHRVLADFIRGVSEAPGKEVEVVATLLIRVMTSTEGRGAEGLTRVRACAPSAYCVFGNWSAGPITDTGFSTALSFANMAGIILAHWGHQAFAGDLFEAVASASGRRLGAEHPDTLSVIDNLAITRRARGDYSRAQELQERVLEATRRISGDEHPDTLAVMNNLALTRSGRGDYGGAKELQQHVMEVRLRIFGIDHSDTLSSIYNLANTLHALGDTSAKDLLEYVVEVRRRIAGDEHTATIAAMNALANIRGDAGDHTGAKALQQHVFEVRRRQMGDGHPDTVSAMNNLAVTESILGDHAAAQELLDRALELSHRLWEGEHPDTLACMNNLAITRRRRGDHASALELHEHVLQARFRVLGAEHPDTVSSMSNVANLRSDKGEHAEAQELQECVLEVRRRILGDEHPDTLTARSILAGTRLNMGDYAGAQELQEQVLEASRRIRGDEHPDTLTVMSDLSIAYMGQGNHARAQELQERVLDVRQRILGDEHLDTLLTMSNLAVTRRRRGDYERAQELQGQAFEGMRRSLGLEHPWTTVAAWELLQNYLIKEDLDSANRLLSEALLWLLERDPVSVVEQQRQIQAELRSLIASQSDHSAANE